VARPQLRLQVVQAAFGVALLILLARAGQVQLLQGSRHAATARSQRTERVELAAQRGTIYDRNGTPLALTQRVYRVVSEPWAYFHGPFTAVQVQRLLHVRGVYPEAELVRFYPDPDLARAVIGRPAAEGRPASGLERILESVLDGTPGSAVVLRDRLGNTIESPSGLGAFPVAGYDVELTIDAELQEIVEGALADGVEQYDAAGGDVVVLNPRTGEVLAVASVDASGRSATSAFTSVFEPGSTAKLFAAAALLRHGLVEDSDSVWAEQGEYRVGSRTIRDEHPNGWLTLTEVIEQSSNIGIAKFSLRLTPEWQFEQLREFGLGSPTGVGFPAESPGILRAPYRWSGTTPASLAMGYEVALTALQLAQAYGAIANDGVMLRGRRHRSTATSLPARPVRRGEPARAVTSRTPTPPASRRCFRPTIRSSSWS
jgi:cell division protein FtsI (penicillin-binding protein 3)